MRVICSRQQRWHGDGDGGGEVEDEDDGLPLVLPSSRGLPQQRRHPLEVHQLLSGREFARSDDDARERGPIHSFAQQMANYVYLSLIHI